MTGEYAQGDLFSVPAAEDTDRPLTPAERFEAFHEANPHIYELLVELARKWKRATGRDRLGIARLWEQMRWQLDVQTTETPKLNNDYKAYFARLIMRDEPDLAELFEVRRSHADDVFGQAA